MRAGETVQSGRLPARLGPPTDIAVSPLITQTRQQLGKLTSPGKFEILATAVLREADLKYATFLHVGTNVSAVPIRSPVDGIDIRILHNGRHLLMVQHTITARRGLRRKWLEPEVGDVAKSMAIFNEEKSRGRV